MENPEAQATLGTRLRTKSYTKQDTQHRKLKVGGKGLLYNVII